MLRVLILINTRIEKAIGVEREERKTDQCSFSVRKTNEGGGGGEEENALSQSN